MLSKHLNIYIKSARSIIARAEARDGVVEVKRGGATYHKVDNEMKQILSDILSNDNTATLKEINNQLRDKLPDKPHIHYKYLSTVLDGRYVFFIKEINCPTSSRK